MSLTSPECSVASSPWRLMAFGLIAALLAHAFPLLRFLLHPLVTLLHEFGHAVAAWLLGCPAIPAFDFVYGGGVTHHQNFQWPLGVLIALGWVWLGWTFRRNPRSLGLIVFAAALWGLAISSEWRRELTIAAMGHLGELLLGSTLLFMALSGRGWRHPAVERPLGAFAGFFVVFQTFGFARRLRSDAGFLDTYRQGKGGALMNDLEVVALDLKIWTGVDLDIERVAGGLLVASILMPALAFALYLGRESLAPVARSLLRLDR